MALTPEGKKLTEAHRKGQLAIAAKAVAASHALWPLLDVADLDRSTPRWLAANVAVARRFFGQSVNLAQTYIGEYRDVELGANVGDIARGSFPVRDTMERFRSHGPIRVKQRIKAGQSPYAAHSSAWTKQAGQMSRQTLMGGRLTVARTARGDREAVGWRRVTDGDPCTFCAMLASRGPVYGSRSLALEIQGGGLRYHGHCGCTGELVYGEWQPNESEQWYIDEYYKAAAEADEANLPRTEENILWRMRESGFFNDSPDVRSN